MLEYVDHDLKSIIKKVGQKSNNIKFCEENIKVILYNILCAVNFIHTANIIHRDLKPANILITDESEIRICDFGLARSINNNHD